MARKRERVLIGSKEDADLISKLPDHVIHHILSFLPTDDAVRTSLVSRRWRQMWSSVPTFDFTYKSKPKTVEQYLKNRKMVMQCNTSSVITRFRFWTDYNVENSQVDSWLSFAAQPHLQELYLRMNWNNSARECYRLPQVALNLKSLTSLVLANVKLEACYPISLPSLKSLSLWDVKLEDEVLKNLLFGCPSIEKVDIEDFHKLRNLQVSSLSLKLLEIDGEWRTIQLDAVNLQSFLYFSHAACHCQFDLASCKKIKNLELSHAKFYPDQDFESIISGLALLERLELSFCDPIGIRNQNLKVLVLRVYPNWRAKFGDKYEFSIDTPNLVSFEYQGAENTLANFLMKSTNLLETNITLEDDMDTISMDWYINIIDFLSKLDCSKSISLLVCSEEALMFPEKLRKFCRSPLPNLKHLKVETCSKLKRESNLKDALHWLSPSLETLSISQERLSSLHSLLHT